MTANRKRLAAAGIIFILILFLLFMSSPASLPLPLLTAPFMLLFIFFYLLTQLFLDRLAPKLSKQARRALSISIAALPVLLLVLQSISQLTVRDLLITTSLIILLLFYFRKIDFLV